MWHVCRNDYGKDLSSMESCTDCMVGIEDYYSSISSMRHADSTDNFTGMGCPHCNKNDTYIIEKSTSWTSKGPLVNLKGGCVNCGVSFNMKLIDLGK